MLSSELDEEQEAATTDASRRVEFSEEMLCWLDDIKTECACPACGWSNDSDQDGDMKEEMCLSHTVHMRLCESTMSVIMDCNLRELERSDLLIQNGICTMFFTPVTFCKLWRKLICVMAVHGMGVTHAAYGVRKNVEVVRICFTVIDDAKENIITLSASARVEACQRFADAADDEDDMAHSRAILELYAMFHDNVNEREQRKNQLVNEAEERRARRLHVLEAKAGEINELLMLISSEVAGAGHDSSGVVDGEAGVMEGEGGVVDGLILTSDGCVSPSMREMEQKRVKLVTEESRELPMTENEEDC